ncbi:hypothetical protein P1J78_13580 [Psychromarinibacter sp. C21-152]|uniref:Uncharacterized protein n=1 Tax=Psychromarinibacter sediminicola TaxID=3033385 RepID=A0AAE3NTK7_9RHOB|nr:hypothetical protein [Psychromarinibacter sediminicola]MDF0601771.1 hypothetical protein [Psychromarinibacter sediminicola]
MKIAENTDTRFVLDRRPWILSAFLALLWLGVLWAGLDTILSLGEPTIGLIYIGLGTAFLAPFLYGFVRRSRLILDRPAGLVIRRHRTLFGVKQDEHPLDTLDRAVVERRRWDNSTTYRLSLRLGERTVPALGGWNSGGAGHDAAKAINRWLDVPEPDTVEV